MAWPRGVKEGGGWVGGKKELPRCGGYEMILRLHLEQPVVSDSKEKVHSLKSVWSMRAVG